MILSFFQRATRAVSRCQDRSVAATRLETGAISSCPVVVPFMISTALSILGDKTAATCLAARRVRDRACRR
jgi:hypothetical protein